MNALIDWLTSADTIRVLCEIIGIVLAVVFKGQSATTKRVVQAVLLGVERYAAETMPRPNTAVKDYIKTSSMLGQSDVVLNKMLDELGLRNRMK